ncbi:hypothetical protein J3R84_32245 (plasmid) [Ensifer canadensis]|nr:hypothetical protein J3R84_32245 [Ensifer canadensis]
MTSQSKIEETVCEGQIGGKKLKVRMTLTAETCRDLGQPGTRGSRA